MKNADDKKGAPVTATPNADKNKLPQTPAAAQDPELELWEHVAANMSAVYECFAMLFGAPWTPEDISKMAHDFASDFMRRRAALMEGKQ